MLEEERRSKDEILASKQSIERKSKEFIENQQRKMEELNVAKVCVCVCVCVCVREGENLSLDFHRFTFCLYLHLSGKLRKAGEGTSAPAGIAEESAQPQRRDTERLRGAVSVTASELTTH